MLIVQDWTLPGTILEALKEMIAVTFQYINVQYCMYCIVLFSLLYNLIKYKLSITFF